MKHRLLPAAVVGLAVGLAYLASVEILRPAPEAAPENPSTPAAPPLPPAVPAPLVAVVDVLDIDPLLDPPADPDSGSAPEGPVVTAFGGEPVPQPVRPASAVVPIPPAEDDPPAVEVAPMPREVSAETAIDRRDPVGRLAGCSDLRQVEWAQPITESSERTESQSRVFVDSAGRIVGLPGTYITGGSVTLALAGCPWGPIDCPDPEYGSVAARLVFPDPAAPLARWCQRNWYGEDRLPHQARHDWDPLRGMLVILPYAE